MTSTLAAVDTLRRERPEWTPWLMVLDEVAREITAPFWDAEVPEAHDRRAPGAPMLTGAAFALQVRPLRDWLVRLFRTAARSGAPKMATLQAVSIEPVEVLSLFAASLAQDRSHIGAIAEASHADAEAFEAIAALLAVPFLQACRRRWASVAPAGWLEPYCPVCGSWPAFAEVRGIERSRAFRCGRCGSGWPALPLKCPYCANDDHEALVSLVPATASPAVVEACLRCQGYLKSITRLQGCGPADVAFEDLATVGLDVAALEQGFRRPHGAAHAVTVALSEAPPRRRRFTWTVS